jgi:hypothetical protein
MTTHPVGRRRVFLARMIAIAALSVAAIGVGTGTASARPSCPTLSSAIAKMTLAAERARQGGYTEAANYFGGTALYYASLSEQYGCI